MDVILFGIALVALTAFVAAPLYARAATPTDREAPDARRDALITALRELEVDRASGLITDDAYERERTALEQHAAD